MMKTKLTNFLGVGIFGTALSFIIHSTVVAAATDRSKDEGRYQLRLQRDRNRRVSATTTTSYKCPSDDQPPIILDKGNVRLETSSNRELCTLTRKSQSKPGLVPVGRSYDRKDWENVAGPYTRGGTPLVFNCDNGVEGTCDVVLPSVNSDESFVLTSYRHSRKKGKTDEVARFLEHATFGPTKKEINDPRWDKNSNLKRSFAEWVADQVNPDVTPPTHHREWWRRHVNPRLSQSWEYGKPGPHPCDVTSRWRTFALSAADVGKHIKLKKKSSSAYVVYVDEHVRTVIDQPIVLFDPYDPQAINNEHQLEMNIEYEICDRAGEVVGGTLSLLRGSHCLTALEGNPRVLITNHVLDDVLLVDRLDLQVGAAGSGGSPLEYINEDTYGNEHFDSASGDELILNVALEDDVCDILPDPWDDSTNNQPVFGRFLDGAEIFVMHDPRLSLNENTVENPLGDGGGMQMHQTDGITLCSNVRRTPFNEDTCRVSRSPLACGASTTPEISLHVDHDFLLMLHEVTGRYVYAVDGLNVFQAYNISKVKSPCRSNTVSRWIPVHHDDCRNSALSNETMAVFRGLLSGGSSDDDDTDNAVVRDIIFPDEGVSCGDGDRDRIVGADILVHDTGICWRNVHPHHLNVYDFTTWSEEHLGGVSAITQFATNGKSTLTFPYYLEEHVISRWHDNINRQNIFSYVGRLGDNVRYADLPLDLQRVEVAAAPTNSGPGVVVCGSPGEVSSDPNLGDGYDIRNKHIHYSTTSDGTFLRQRQTVWTLLALQAPDQLRQRMAWALSQILVVAPKALPDPLSTETKLNYYDIFTRHAFGNYLDVLREVAFSPLMGEFLSYRNSKSLSYQLQKTGMLGYPDENFAREVMQLFSIGLVRLNRDGTPALDSTTGEVVSVYGNDDILSFARAWTGFRFRTERGNVEDKYDQTANRIDPMEIDSSWRDPFPKMDVNGRYIGDGYPPCVDLPPQHFLRIGAKWRILGSNALPEMQKDREEWANGVAGGPEVKRVVLRQDSELRRTLCNAATSGGECNYASKVVLDSNLACDVGVECHVDSVRVAQVAPDVFYEYIRPPCVELPFFNDGKKVLERSGASPMCADPRGDTASEACCITNSSTTARYRNCEYTGERTTYARANERCAAIGKTQCDHEKFSSSHCRDAEEEAGNDDGSCCAHDRNYFWTSGECSVQVKVNSEGKVAIVHALVADRDVSYKVRRDTRNYFRVNWENGHYPKVSDDCGGACLVHHETCLCNTTVSDEAVFASMATASRDEVLSRLHIGSSHPDAFEGSSLRYRKSKSSTGDVKLYYREDEFSADSIFEVQRYGVTHFLQNKISTVRIVGATQFAFRNPPSFMSLVDPEVRDAYHETEAVLRHYMYHDNTAPFLATRLLQRFGKSNPSPRYVEAVATAFQSGTYEFKRSIRFGSKRYGDLASTVAAILLDREATSVVLDADPAQGSLREPLLKVIGFMRSMQYSHDAPLIQPFLYDLQDRIGQMAYDVKTVFSFFLPEYLPPGPLSRASLASPEAGVLTTDNVVGLLNGLFSMIKYGLSNCEGGFGPNVGSCAQLEVKSYSRSIGHLSYSPPSDSIDDAEAVVDELATLLTGGRLSDKNREIIQGAYSSADQDMKLLVAQQLVVTTAEFHSTNLIQKADIPRIPVKQPSEPGNDYKAVVFVMLMGGVDSYNMLVPHSDCGGKDLYGEYTQVRGSVALEKTELLKIDASRTPQQCNKFGIHNELSELKNLYNDGDLVFLADVGLLVEPVTKSDWIAKTKTQLFAHNTMQREAYKVDPESRTGETGVLGRMCDVLRTKGFKTGSVSVDGSSLALAGDPDFPVTVVAKGGVEEFRYYPNTNLDMVIESLNNATSENSGMFAETWSSGLHRSLVENEFYSGVLQSNHVSQQSGFGSDGLSKQLEMVSRLIKGHRERGTDRDVFYVKLNGFDAHSELELNLKENFGAVNTAIKAFASEMKGQGHWNDVTLVTASDFGRTLTPNTGGGTDHAWSGNYFMLGGPVDGGKILGTYPDDLTEEGPQHIGRGRLIPKTPWDAIWNGVGQWFGITQKSDLDYVLPNRVKFGKCGVFSEKDLYGNGEDIGDCTEESEEQCQLTTNWVEYGSNLETVTPGPDGSNSAVSSSGRSFWSHGLVQYLNNACLVAGQQWRISAKIKLLDELDNPYECSPEAPVGNGASCPLFRILSEPVDETLPYSAFLENDVQQQNWIADNWNEFSTVLTVNQEMESGVWTKLFLFGPRPDVTILMGALSIVPL